VATHEPHKIKTVRLLSFPTLHERKRYLAQAHFNTFHLTPSQVVFDMCSYGTGAMSQEQLSGQFIGDEAYAGSRNFEVLQEAVSQVFGHGYVCPTHNLLGSVKLVVATMVQEGSVLPTNSRDHTDLLAPRGLEAPYVRDEAEEVFTGNISMASLGNTLEQSGSSTPVPLLVLQAFADGQHPFSLENLREVRARADRRGVRLVLDGSRVVENAWYIQKHEKGQADRSIAEIVKQIAKTAHVFMFDGGQDAGATPEAPDHRPPRRVREVHERGGGLRGPPHLRRHGRPDHGGTGPGDHGDGGGDGGPLGHGPERAVHPAPPGRRSAPGARVRRGLPPGRGLPSTPGGEPAGHPGGGPLLRSGVRVVAPGLAEKNSLLPVQVPRLCMTNDQLDQVADAIIHLHARRDASTPCRWSDGSGGTRWPTIGSSRTWTFEFDTFPFQIHTIERVGVLSREAREKAMRAAGYNTFLLRSADVAIDLLTDSGTTAMSVDQWAAYEGVRASAATSDEYFDFVEALQEVFGYEYILPTHQGRAAEHILSQTRIRPGQLVPGNMYFTTTKLHQEMAGGTFADVIVDEAHDPASDFPWKETSTC
jgi:tryptophanase